MDTTDRIFNVKPWLNEVKNPYPGYKEESSG